MTHKLAVITVVYKNYSILNDFLDSFGRQSNNNLTIFIADLTPGKERIGLKPPQNVKIMGGENKGYAYGVNLGLRKALVDGYRYFCVLNNDVVVKEDFVEKVIGSIKSHPKSLIGGKIYYAKGYEYYRAKYNRSDLGKIIWFAGGFVDWKNVLTIHQGVDKVDKGQFNQFKKTDFITGCLICFDKKVLEKIGFWDEKYFLYYEDADFCQRAKQEGIGLYYDPSIIIWHKNAQSTGGSGSKLHQKEQRKSRLRFGLKYAPLKTKFHLLKNYFC